MNEIQKIQVLGDYRIWISFRDGLEKIINFQPFIGNGFTVELLDPRKFEQVFVEDGGGIAWPNGFDFCPNYLHNYVPGEVMAEA